MVKTNDITRPPRKWVEAAREIGTATLVGTLARVIDSLWLAFPWDILQVIPGRLDQSIGEHNEMVEAVRGGDVVHVKTVFEEHITHSYLSLVAHLTGEEADDPYDLAVD